MVLQKIDEESVTEFINNKFCIIMTSPVEVKKLHDDYLDEDMIGYSVGLSVPADNKKTYYTIEEDEPDKFYKCLDELMNNLFTHSNYLLLRKLNNGDDGK